MHSILVAGRADAAGMPARADWVVVSIRDPGKPAPLLRRGWRAVLSLEFHDKEDLEIVRMTGLWRLFTPCDAALCWKFIAAHRSGAAGLLVHCEAGLSRSPAIARAVAERIGLRCDDAWPRGNLHVYATMRESAYAPIVAVGD